MRGVVADAQTRNVAAPRRLGFRVFVAGIQAQDSLGRVEVDKANVPIHDAVALEVVERAERKVATESRRWSPAPRRASKMK